jgi:ribosomal protein S18 acetylase RimI-like enzyme
MLRIDSARMPEELPVAHAMFLEYAQSLGVDLSFQGFDDEVASLPGDYVPPRGALLFARADGVPIGVVAMRPLEPGVCEMKRLFVRPESRGSGAGRLLAEAILDAGRRAGYERMRLDTLPGMDAAFTLYRRPGFREIPPYRHNPVAGTRFLECRLTVPSPLHGATEKP